MSQSEILTFTDRARKVMQLANRQAQDLNHEYIGTEHILLGIVYEGRGVADQVLRHFNIDPGTVCVDIKNMVRPGRPDMISMGKLTQTPEAREVMGYAIEEAHRMNHNHIGTEHMLLGLLHVQKGIAARVLTKLGLTLVEARDVFLYLLGGANTDVAPELPGASIQPLSAGQRDLEYAKAIEQLKADIARGLYSGPCVMFTREEVRALTGLSDPEPDVDDIGPSPIKAAFFHYKGHVIRQMTDLSDPEPDADTPVIKEPTP